MKNKFKISFLAIIISIVIMTGNNVYAENTSVANETSNTNSQANTTNTSTSTTTNTSSSGANNSEASTTSNTTKSSSNTATNKSTTATKSSNANLKNLGIRPNDFSGFKAAVTSYEVTAPLEVEKIEDNWDVIATNVKNGNSSKYNVGAEKEVLIDGKEYRVRVANNSTPSECGNSEFSQTACGLVFEFVDVIENRVMNTENTNSGSWSASEMRTYVNGDLYNKLSEELKKNIIDTKVVTGHGRNDTSNFTSTDKLYLLSGHEVYEDDVNNKISEFDTAYNQTRQLDFYKSKNVVSNGIIAPDSTIILQKDVLKYNNGASAMWWLRAPSSSSGSVFFGVASRGFWDGSSSHRPLGLAPAFRIG